jgi:hypothetical protein
MKNLLIFSLFMLSAPLRPFCYPHHERLCTLYNNATYVFTARIESTCYYWCDNEVMAKQPCAIPWVTGPESDCMDAILFKAKIITSYKGVAGQEVVLACENASARAVFDAGKSYLIFGYPSQEKHNPRVIWVDGCQSDLNDAEYEFPFSPKHKREFSKVISDFKTKQAGSVNVQVLGKGNAGVPFVIESIASDFKRKFSTDKKGWLKTALAPGKYKIYPSDPKSKLATEVPQDVAVEFELDWGGGFDQVYVRK